MNIWRDRLPWDNITRVATHAGLLPALLGAFVAVESSGNPDAVRFEPNYRYLSDIQANADRLGISPEAEKKNQQTSWGLVQIMGATARWLGFRDPMEKLCEPETGLLWGCIYLSRLINKYKTLEDAVASYNAGSPRRKDDGSYVNQDYVDKVIHIYNDLRQINTTIA